MRPELLLFASDLAKRGEPFALVTVVRRGAPSSARVGDMAIVTLGGEFHGWVGGSCTQPTVVREALRAITHRLPRLIALSPSPGTDRRPGVETFPMTCHSGGSVDIYIEPVLPAPRLVVLGASPVGRSLVRLGKALGYNVDAADPAADRATFPEADRVFSEIESAPMRQKSGAAGAWVGAVVATMGHWDKEGLRAALALEPDYLGVVASKTRFAGLREMLQGSGSSAASLAAIHNPAGLDIGAESPEEVALSVLAEIVRLRRALPAATSVAPAARVAAAESAIDPICGMTVTIATARHKADFEGRTYHFCGGGCREKFLREPQRYSAVPASESAR